MENLGLRPTRLYDIVLLHPTMDGYHNASGYMFGGALLPVPTPVPRTPQHQPSAAATSLEPTGAHPIVWRVHFSVDITTKLVSWGDPEVQVTNSDLDLAGSTIHHACMANFFEICERTTLSQTDNTVGLWWQIKGSATSMSS